MKIKTLILWHTRSNSTSGHKIFDQIARKMIRKMLCRLYEKTVDETREVNLHLVVGWATGASTMGLSAYALFRENPQPTEIKGKLEETKNTLESVDQRSAELIKEVRGLRKDIKDDFDMAIKLWKENLDLKRQEEENSGGWFSWFRGKK